MTTLLPGVELPRPAAAPDPGPLDERFYDLVETRVRRLLTDNPVLATLRGIHTEDHRLGDGSRDALLGEIAADRAHLAAVEALDDARLSHEARFERDLEVHNVRYSLFEVDEYRRWERTGTATEAIGDGVFLLFARGAAPLAERIERIADRLEAAPAYIEETKSRVVGVPVRTWLGVEARSADELPTMLREVLDVAEVELSSLELARLRRAIDGATGALADYAGWLRHAMGHASDDWPLGRERYDELVRLRSFGDLDA